MFPRLLSEGFGELPLTELDLGYCHKLDQVATLQLIIEKFQGLTKLRLADWKITELTEGDFSVSVCFGLTVPPSAAQRLRRTAEPLGPQLALLREAEVSASE